MYYGYPLLVCLSVCLSVSVCRYYNVGRDKYKITLLSFESLWRTLKVYTSYDVGRWSDCTSWHHWYDDSTRNGMFIRKLIHACLLVMDDQETVIVHNASFMYHPQWYLTISLCSEFFTSLLYGFTDTVHTLQWKVL